MRCVVKVVEVPPRECPDRKSPSLFGAVKPSLETPSFITASVFTYDS